MIERRSRCRNSIGSSIVTMCLAAVRLTWSMIAASVELLPEPVVPVRRMIPRSSSATSPTTVGSPSCSIERISWGTERSTSEMTPRWRKAFTRKRDSPGTPKAKSTSFWSVNSCSLSLSVPSSSASTRSVSSGESGCESGIGSSRPCRRISGCEGTFRWRSEPSISMTRRSAGSSWNMWTTSDVARWSLRLGPRHGGLASVIVERGIEIARPGAEVFAFVADPRNDVRWCPKGRSVERLSDDRYAVVHKPVPLRPARRMELTVVRLDPPRQLELRQDDGTDVFRVTYALEPTAAGGTRFRQRSDAELGVPRFLHPLWRRGIGRDLARQLRELKQVLEGENPID